MKYLREIRSLRSWPGRRASVDAKIAQRSQRIVDDVRKRGERGLLAWSGRLGDWQVGDPWIFDRRALQKGYRSLPIAERRLLRRVVGRIETFARAQRRALREFRLNLPYGRAGQVLRPVSVVGCYAPGGRFSLPSSVLMTVATARMAGVREIYVCSPKPTAVTLAAAFVAGAHTVFGVGGAQAIAAMAYGAGRVPRADMIVGPGNAYVTAAKRIVMGEVGIDSLAGPSEVLIVADRFSRPDWIAADLLAQAEHDPQAIPMLVALDREILPKVDFELNKQLSLLPNRKIAGRALRNGFVWVARKMQEVIQFVDAVAPEHLELHTRNPARLWRRFSQYGALFVGDRAAEVFGDYGAGPNHVLPTSGCARFSAGLSVYHFLHVRTWLEMRAQPKAFIRDVKSLARMEGLFAHAMAADRRNLR